jgi:3-deoxy-manno-octulosonate cytidylyltransferase (CMP-KDO synthetase)
VNGTARCQAAMAQLPTAIRESSDFIINIQADEPMLQLNSFNDLITLINQNTSIQIATLFTPIQSIQTLNDPKEAKVVFNNQLEALYFSRAPIPYQTDKKLIKKIPENVYYKHVGIYAFSKQVLQKLNFNQQAAITTFESLEQNNWLALGYTIKLAITQHDGISVDTHADLEKIKKMF